MAFRGQDAGRGAGWGADRAATAGPDQQVSVARLASRAGLSLALMAGFVWLLADRWAQIDGAALAQAFARLNFGQWIAALGFTALSFWAVGRYDAVLHRHFASLFPARMARRAGVCAIAVSQTLGLGLISGAILRWRMLPGTSLWQATRLTAAVALSFLAGWAVVTSTVLIAVQDAPYKGWAAGVLVTAGLLTALSIWAPILPGLRFRWPNGFTLLRLLGLCAVDTLAAAAAFYALLPEAVFLPFATLLPAFLLALGAGLALGTPGGMGAFEITLIALLPVGETPDLLAAILAWRLVYYAVPAILGAGIAMLGPAPQARPPSHQGALPHSISAEMGLCRQGTLSVVHVGGQAWMLARHPHTRIAVSDPAGRRRAPALDLALLSLDQMARNESLMPVVYKAGARLAARGRAQGQAVRRIAWEAWIAPADYRLASSSRGGLRRKLRRAEAAGVKIRFCSAETAPWPALDQIAEDWACAHGGERGFSMGRHNRDYLSHQRLYIASLGGKPIAYVSFHTAPDEWALDLMRHGKNLPDGTMHSLVQAAIDDAVEAKIAQLSLAAVPDLACKQYAEPASVDLAHRLIAAVAPETASTGLFRFKSAFAPRWKPLYILAPNRPGLVLAGLSLWRAITRPPPIMTKIERDDAQYGFASVPAAWHIAKDR